MERLYHGMTTFEEMNIPNDLLKGVYAAGFQTPSKIQEKALPILLANPPLNLIAQSQSGTGKTAAFSLAALSRVDPSKSFVQAIVLAPARELARQIGDVITELGKFSDVNVALGIKENAEIRESTTLVQQILVGTPGTVMDLIRRKKVDPTNIVFFVLDEADNMLDQQGLGDQSIRVQVYVATKRLTDHSSELPKTCQVALFSATFPPNVRAFAEQVAPGASKLTLKQDELSVEGIKQFYMDCDNADHKFDILIALYGLLTIGQSIIFVNVRSSISQVN